MFHELGASVYLFSAFFGLGFIAILVQEAYRFFYKKEDRMFWSGLSTFFVMTLTGSIFYFSIDLVDRYHFKNSIDNVVMYGQVDYKSLAKSSKVEHSSCLVNDSEKSKQCMFLMLFKNFDGLADFVVNNETSFVRFGEWPFEREQEFSKEQLPIKGLY